MFGTWLLGWTGDNGDPDNWVCVFFCNTKEAGMWDDATAQQAVKLMKDAASETDTAKRAELYKQVSKLIQQDASRVPLVQAEALVAATKKVRGLVPHPIGVESYGQVWLGK